MNRRDTSPSGDGGAPPQGSPARGAATSFGDHTPEFLDRNRKKMAAIDRLPRDIRELVHEYNWTLVDQFLRIGVTNAKHIRHLIKACRDGANYAGNGLHNFYCTDCPKKIAR